jgi:hypothetical protein
MLQSLRSRLTYANVMATVAVFVALGGTGYAAAKLNGKTIKHRTVPGKALKRNTVTGTEVKESKLGKVRLAGRADAATLADSAKTAESATNAATVGGVAPGAFQGRVQWAIVSKFGTILAQSGGISAVRNDTGVFFVDFGAPVVNKAVVTAAFATPADGGFRGGATPFNCGGGAYGVDCSSLGITDDHHVVVTTFAANNTAKEDHDFVVTVTP